MASFLDTVKSALTGAKSSIESWVKKAAWSIWITKESIWAANKFIENSPTLSKAAKPGMEGIIWVWEVISSWAKEGAGALGWLLDTWLEKIWVSDSNFKWVLGNVAGSVASVPTNIIAWGKTIYEWGKEAIDLVGQWEYGKAAARATKKTLEGGLGIVSNISGIPIFVNAWLAAAWLTDAVNEWTQTLKSNLSTQLQWFGFDKTISDDIGSGAIDAISLYLMRKWGQESAKIWGKAKVQGLADTVRQNQILKTVEQKAAAVPNATPASIAAAVERAKPAIANATAKPVSLTDVAVNNLKSFGYDVAANSAIPVLWLAVNAVDKWDYGDISEALGSNAFATSISAIIPGFKWIKAMKWWIDKPDVAPKTEAPVEALVKPETTTPSPVKWNKFLDTNPTPEQLAQAKILTDRDNAGIWNISKELRENTILTDIQKKAILETSIDDRIYAQTKPKTEAPVEAPVKPETTTKTLSEIVQEKVSPKEPVMTEEITVTPNKWRVEYKENPETSAKLDAAIRENTGLNNKSVTIPKGNKGEASIKVPDAQFKLWLAGVAWLKNIASIFWRNFNTGVFLNNIKVKVGDAFVPLGNYISRAQTSIRPSLKKAILDDANIVKWNTAKLETTQTKFDKNDLIGTKSPEWVEITKENASEFEKSFNNIKDFNKTIDGLSTADTQNIVRASYIYDFLKQKPDLLPKYFTPEQIVFLNRLDAIEQQTYGKVSTKAKADDVLWDVVLDDDYRHFDVIPSNYQRIPQSEITKTSITTPDGRVIEFNNALELASYVKNRGKYGVEVDPSTFSGLEKEQKWAQIEPYRTHGSAARLISYADSMWKFYADDFAVKMLDQLRQTKDSATKTYVDRGFDSSWNKNIVEQFLWVSDAGKIAKVAQFLTNVGSKKSIIGNWKVYSQSAMSAWVKNLADSVKSATENLGLAAKNVATGDLGKAGTSLVNVAADVWLGGILGTVRSVLGSSKALRDPSVKETLSNEGFIGGIENADFWMDSKLGKALALSSGLLQENSAKTEIALRSMRNTLTQAWYLSGTEWLSARNITDAWKKFKEESKWSPEYLVASDQILQNTKLVADVSRLSRLTTAGLYNLTGWLKSYALGNIAQNLWDAGNLINYIWQKTGLREDKTVWWQQAWGSVARMATQAASYATVYSAIYNMLDPTMDDELKKSITKAYTNRIVSNPFSMANDTANSLFTNVGLTQGVDIGKTLALAMYEYSQAENTDVGKKIAYNELYSLLQRQFAVLGTASDAKALYDSATYGGWGKTFKDIVAEKLGTPSMENTTRSGLATGAKTDSFMERLLMANGFNQDQAVLNYMYSELDDAQLWAMNPIQKTLALWGKNLVKGIERSEFPLVSDAASYINGWSIDPRDSVMKRIDAQYAFDAAKNINRSKSFNDYLMANNIDTAYAPLIWQMIQWRANTIFGSYDKKWDVTKATWSNQVEQTMGWRYDPRKITSTYFPEMMEEVRQKNPKYFNDIVSAIGKVARYEDERQIQGWLAPDLSTLKVSKQGKLSANDTVASDISDKFKNFFWDHSAQDANSIYNVYHDRPLQTSITNTIKWAMEDFAKNISKEGTQKAFEKLDMVEAMTKLINQNSQYTNQYIDAINLANVELRWGLAKLFTLGGAKAYSEFVKRYPNLIDSLKEWLSLRWEDVKNWKDETPAQREYRLTGKVSWYNGSTWTNLPINLEWWIPQKKLPKLKLQNGWSQQKKVWSLWPVKSLAEIIAQKQLQMSQPWTQSATAKNRLATFQN